MFAKPYHGDCQLTLNRRFVKFGVMPLPATPSKIIYGESSGQMYVYAIISK